MSDNHNIPLQSPPMDPYGAKANFDVNEKKLHLEGPPGFIRQVTNLLILAGIIAFIVVLVRVF
ncbi:hypothetical protein [Paenibacillus sp. NPDC058177]|uniref:hypothetical protein n=1 Tax=Paenibacillus sp. NPDC058177 TaxID=3346369 RepID=UPI0036DD4B1C